MTRSTDTITGITVETDGTLQVTDMRVDEFLDQPPDHHWARRGPGRRP